MTFVRDSLRLPALVENLAWQGAKLVAVLVLREIVHRVRAGPLTVSVAAPVVGRHGDPFEVAVTVESPFELADLSLYFAGTWRDAKAVGGVGVRHERWLLHGPTPGLRPIVVRARDREGHALTRTRWLLVMPSANEMPALADWIPRARRANGTPREPVFE